MRKRAFGLALAICMAAALPAIGPADSGRRVGAQEGHPLSGTWRGDWGPGATERTRVTLVMSWDGTRVSGLINPGPNAIPLTTVVVDWTNWTIRLEGDTKDASGAPVRVEADGRLEDIGSYHRKIVGTWTQGGVSGDLTLTRE